MLAGELKRSVMVLPEGTSGSKSSGSPTLASHRLSVRLLAASEATCCSCMDSGGVDTRRAAGPCTWRGTPAAREATRRHEATWAVCVRASSALDATHAHRRRMSGSCSSGIRSPGQWASQRRDRTCGRVGGVCGMQAVQRFLVAAPDQGAAAHLAIAVVTQRNRPGVVQVRLNGTCTQDNLSSSTRRSTAQRRCLVPSECPARVPLRLQHLGPCCSPPPCRRSYRRSQSQIQGQ